jgi:hypothetical protein
LGSLTDSRPTSFCLTAKVFNNSPEPPAAALEELIKTLAVKPNDVGSNPTFNFIIIILLLFFNFDFGPRSPDFTWAPAEGLGAR